MNPLNNRLTSGFPLSFSTGQAMETLFQPRQAVYDPERVAPPRISLASYDELWINVLTLIRNAYSSIERIDVERVGPLEMAETILQEIELIRDLLKIEGNGICLPNFYFNDYNRVFPKNDQVFKLRKDTTDIQIQTRVIYNKSKDLIIRQDPDIKTFTTYLRSKEGLRRAVILSHIPFDLLSYQQFKSLELLESHTGKIKRRSEWNSKYLSCGGADKSRLPFNRQLLSIFGDQPLITPLPLKLRKSILEIANQQRWTPAITQVKVSNDLNKNIKDPFFLSKIKEIPLF